MNRSITLERSVIVKCWRVGQVAKAEKRTELIPVLLRVRETGGTDARGLAEHLLFESRSRRVVADRLLNIAHAYGLVEKEERARVFTLTEAGERAIDTDGTEREAMVCDLGFESPHIPDYGEFDPITVREVPITPATEADAQSWAKWRLHTRIQDYATSERYAAWCAEAADPFDQYEIDLPTRTELFDEVCNRTTNRPDPKFWHLVAAEDWRL